jgi:transcriptional regulator with XRE-family HTH domain
LAVPAGAGLGSVLGSPGMLLRAWRAEMGWTQDDVARTLRVSRAAVTSWETDARRIPAQALADLDFAYAAGGCLTDLALAISFPQGSYGGSLGAGPRRRWGHVFLGEPGPVWAWVRPAAGDRVAGYSRMGLLGMRFDEVTGPDGIFLTQPYASSRQALRVMLAEPGWVDFGRGTVPSWLERPSKTSAGFADVEVIIARHPVIGCYVRAFRDRDRGAPETLRDRLRTLVGPERWDLLESQLRRRGLPSDDAHDDPGPDPRPPDTAAERIVLHRRLREARGMSQADAAAAASALLTAGRAGEDQITRQQIRNYEEGRASRVRHLPALLDMVYGAFGWSCREAVRVTRTETGLFEAAFPGWWVGPVCVTAIPSAAFPATGSLTLISRNRRSDCPLTGAGSRPVGVGPVTVEPVEVEPVTVEPVTVEHLRLPGEPPLRLQVPPGWRLRAYMGHGASAIDADRIWRPTDGDAAGRLFELSVQVWLRQLGRTEADLERALRSEPRA